MSRERVLSAIERLQQLPPLFRGPDLTVRFQWTSKTASQYLYLWKRRELVQPLGGHSDVFANRLVEPNPNWEAAVMLAMPTATIVGIECLRRAGWITQVPSRPEVAVDATQPVYATDMFEVVSRRPSWFTAIAGATESRAADADRSAPVLRPAWALADMLQRADWGACGLQPDDIDWGVVGEADRSDLRQACDAFDLSQSKFDLPEMEPSNEVRRARSQR
jgi:hypothetical protein